MSEPKQPKTRYKTTNWTVYNVAPKARGSLTDVIGCSHPVLPEPQVPVWPGAAPAPGTDSQPAASGEPGLHGAEYRRQWRTVHLSINAHTPGIRAIELTDNSVGDAPMLPGILTQIPTDEPIASVSTDSAHDTKGCHAAIAQRGAQAVIPPRKNGKLRKETLERAAVRNAALRACHRLGWGIWKKWSSYHRRSLLESKRHGFKRLGERVI